MIIQLIKPLLNAFLWVHLLFLPRALVTAQNIYLVGGDISFRILGTSTVHDWEESTSKASGQAKILWNEDGSFNILALDFVVDVKSIKSTKGSIMDIKTYEALKAEEFPAISFKLTTTLSNITPGATVSARGDLKIAGVTNSVALQVKTGGSNSALTFEGTKKINMKEWNVSPPTAFMGTMKVGETVELKFKSTYIKK